jgi:hypothetical protein
MKRSILTAMILNTALLTACGGDCEYETGVATARVSVLSVSNGFDNCLDDPVQVTLVWGTDMYQVTTSDFRNPPRACIEALGLVDGAEVTIRYNQLVGGQSVGLGGALLCHESTVTIWNIDPSQCDAACDLSPVCPASEPTEGQPCAEGLACQYGNENICSPDQGPSANYACIGGVWTSMPIDLCDVCGIGCDPPPCTNCAEALTDYSYPIPPEQLTFCTENSQTLYSAFYTCMCVAGNPCEPVCNTAPAGDLGFCNGGNMTMECQNCISQMSQPDGCQTEFAGCANDL